MASVRSLTPSTQAWTGMVEIRKKVNSELPDLTDLHELPEGEDALSHQHHQEHYCGQEGCPVEGGDGVSIAEYAHH